MLIDFVELGEAPFRQFRKYQVSVDGYFKASTDGGDEATACYIHFMLG